MTNAEANEAGKMILHQLGGARFLVMTGAKNLTVGLINGRPALSMTLPRPSTAPRMVIYLEPTDLYTVETFRLVKTEVRPIAERTGVYCDRLRDVFTALTGLDTSL